MSLCTPISGRAAARDISASENRINRISSNLLGFKTQNTDFIILGSGPKGEATPDLWAWKLAVYFERALIFLLFLFSLLILFFLHFALIFLQEKSLKEAWSSRHSLRVTGNDNPDDNEGNSSERCLLLGLLGDLAGALGHWVGRCRLA